MKNIQTVKDQIAKIQADKRRQLLDSLVLKNIKGGAKGNGNGLSCPPPCCH